MEIGDACERRQCFIEATQLNERTASCKRGRRSYFVREPQPTVLRAGCCVERRLVLAGGCELFRCLDKHERVIGSSCHAKCSDCCILLPMRSERVRGSKRSGRARIVDRP